MMPLKKAWVLEYDNVHVKCITPCCGLIVFHGSCGGENFEGSRSPHCNCHEEYDVKIGASTKKVKEIKR